MELPRLRLVLLALCGTAQVPELDGLDDADWLIIDRLAAMHRLQPLLHHRRSADPALPARLREAWRLSYRQSAATALARREDLVRTVAILRDADLGPIALKGAWLAWHAYPEPALRPLRDLDLLVASSQVLDAYQLLLAAGFTEAEPATMALEDHRRLDKHLPPLLARHGSVIELHHRIWERQGRLDHRLPDSGGAAMCQRAMCEDDGLAYLACDDLLAHLVIHALYSHRLDCGPLLLSDIACLAARRELDWDGIAARAREEGWRDGLELILTLVGEYYPDAPVPRCGRKVPEDLLAGARQLLLQNLDHRQSAGFAATALSQSPRKVADRLLGINRVAGETGIRRSMAGPGGMAAWATSRTLRTLRDLASADARDQARQLARLSRWLDQ